MKEQVLNNTSGKLLPSQLPISIYQKRFFFEWLMNPDNSTYNLSFVFKIEGSLEVATLKKSLEHILAENEVAYARYSSDGENCYQGNYTIDDFFKELEIPSQDILESELHQLLYKPFDLTKEALVRFYLLKSTFSKKPVYHFVSSTHHITSDAEAAFSFVKQIEINYNKLRSGEKLAYGFVKSFTEAVMEEQKALAKTNKEITQKFWLDFIDDIPLSIDLPYKLQNIATNNKSGRAIFFKLGTAQKQQLKAYARSQKTTVFMVVSGVFALLLSKYSRMSRFMMSYPINMRPPKYRGVVGCFVNNIPMKFDFEDVQTFE